MLRWTGDALVAAGASAGSVLAADSWLVDGGRVRAAGAHWARFGAACADATREVAETQTRAAGGDDLARCAPLAGAAAGGDLDRCAPPAGADAPADLASATAPAELARFRAAVEAALPAAGRWFPRVELTAAGLLLRVRPAPPSALDATVTVAEPGDPRAHPRRKGPDLAMLVALREGCGADELLLRDGAGALLEGALSSLLWWEGETLWTTPDGRTLPGVTRALLLEIARARGVEVGVRAPQPQELAGCETWLASALHGIRVVRAWIEPRQPAGAPLRAADWRAELAAHG